MSDKLNVYFVHLSSAPGGIEVLLPEIISGIRDRKFISFVIRPPAIDEPSVYNELNHKVIYGSYSNMIAAWKLFWFARKEKASIFHVSNIGPFFLFVLRLSGVNNLIYSLHDTLYWTNNRQMYLRKVFWWFAIKRKSYIFTSNSEFTKKEFFKLIDKSVKIHLLYNPINLKKFTSNGRKNTDTIFIKRIIYSGRLASGKGLEIWLKLAFIIHKEFNDIQFEIYGDGPLRSILQESIIKNSATDYVELKGHLKNINEAYLGADLLLFLSESESFGNVVVESVLCGTPVITTDIPSMREIFKNFPIFLIPSGEDMESIVLERLNDYSKLKRYCTEAAEEFKVRFSAEKQINLLENIYSEIQMQ